MSFSKSYGYTSSVLALNKFLFRQDMYCLKETKGQRLNDAFLMHTPQRVFKGLMASYAMMTLFSKTKLRHILRNFMTLYWPLILITNCPQQKRNQFMSTKHLPRSVYQPVSHRRPLAATNIFTSACD